MEFTRINSRIIISDRFEYYLPSLEPKFRQFFYNVPGCGIILFLYRH